MRFFRLVLAALGAGLLLWAFMPGPGLLVRVDGRPVALLPLHEGERFQLSWVHSVSHIPVREVFAFQKGRIWLEESHNPWFAAGLGEVPGRGRLVSEAGHAVALVEIHEPAGGLALRIGAPEIHHTLLIGPWRFDLSACFPHRRLTWAVVHRPRVFYLVKGGSRCP